MGNHLCRAVLRRGGSGCIMGDPLWRAALRRGRSGAERRWHPAHWVAAAPQKRRPPRLRLAVALLAGCATAPPPRVVLPADPAARLAAIVAREDEIQSLRARFSSVTRLPGGERSADGVLLVAKPDRFRLRLMLPFGITVFDYLNVGDRSWMALPLADAAQRTRAGDFAPFSRDDLGQAFLRGAYAFPGRCDAAPASDGDVTVTCRANGVLRRTLRIGPEGIAEEASYDAGTLRLRLRYADYRAVDGISLPFHITLDYPQRQQSVAITIERYEVNPALSDTLFQPLPDSLPAGTGRQRSVEGRASARPRRRRSGALQA